MKFIMPEKFLLRKDRKPSGFFFSAVIFFKNFFKNFFSTPLSEKVFPLPRTARITPLLAGILITASLLGGTLFLSLAGAEEGKNLAEQIICPDAKAAAAGSLLDEYYLARAYDKGWCGVTADPSSALQWYLRAAGQRHMLAQYALGEMFFTGNGGEPDYPQAKKWFLAAAEQGHGLSQLRLAFLYAEGHYKGVTVDYKEAEKWFLKAAEQDAGDARFRLGNFYHNYKTPPDFQKAVLWLTRAAEGGNRVAMFDLARLLQNGEGTQKNPVQALVWMKKAADLDLLSAQMRLSEMYATGDGIEKDPLQSLTWTLKIATKPSASPFWIDKAGDIFFKGWETIPQNYPQAINLYARAAIRDDPHALARLGEIYLKGLGTPADTAKAHKYLERAAARGSEEAKEILAEEAQDVAPKTMPLKNGTQ
jgi:TPR repeat protein